MALTTDSWKILQLIPATGWVARFRSGAGELSEDVLASWALVDDGTRTFMVGMIAGSDPRVCGFAPRGEGFVGYFHRGAEMPVAAALPTVQKVAKSGTAWKSAKPDS